LPVEPDTSRPAIADPDGSQNADPAAMATLPADPPVIPVVTNTNAATADSLRAFAIAISAQPGKMDNLQYVSE